MSPISFSLGMPNADLALRNCALTLHGIAAQDRAWVLSRLTGPRRDELKRLIDELDAIGIAPDRQWARTAVRAAGSRAAATAPSQAALDAAQLASVLAHEPASLVAHTVRGRDESFLGSFFAQLRPPLREEVARRLHADSHGRAIATPPQLERALHEEIHARSRLQQQASAQRASIAQRWRSGLRRIGRLLA